MPHFQYTFSPSNAPFSDQKGEMGHFNEKSVLKVTRFKKEKKPKLELFEFLGIPRKNQNAIT